MRLYQIFPFYIILNSILYLKNLFYDYKLFKRLNITNIPIYSIGSIELGGSGKTTLTKAFVNMLIQKGKKPAILSRGYKRKGKGNQIVHNGQSFLTNVSYAGDEPYMLGKFLKTVPIIVDENKSRGINQLLHYDINCIVIDDGYQSRYLNKKIDIVIINNYHHISNYLIFPYGFLREPIQSLKRADLVFLNSDNNIILEKKIKKKIAEKTKIFFYSFHYSLYQYSSMNIFNSVKTIKGDFIAFCGIALPQLFFNQVKKYDITVKKCIRFKNHQAYNDDIINCIINYAKKMKIKQFITTDKDVFKLPEIFFDQYSIYTLSTNIMINNKNELFQFISLKE